MRIDRNSLAYRLIVSISIGVSLVVAVMLAAGLYVVGGIHDDYHHYIAASQADATRRLFDAALAELTTAQLLDNPDVVEAKHRALIESIHLEWTRRGVGGVIVSQDGKLLLSTYAEPLTARILAQPSQAYLQVSDRNCELFGKDEQFYPWGWRVITLVQDHLELSTQRAYLLVPMLVLGPLLLSVILIGILARKLQRPVSLLATAAANEVEAPETGVTELDQIGQAFNLTLARLQERGRHLADELAERKRAETMIRDKEARIRLLLQSTAEGIFGVDINGLCIFCNPACCRILGYSEEALLGQDLHALTHHALADGSPCPRESCRVFAAWHDGLASHMDGEIFRRADGSAFPVEYWSHPIIDDGQVVGAVVAFFDITERKRSSDALRVAWQDWQTTFDSTADLIAVLGPLGEIRQHNRAFAEFFGAEVESLVGRMCFQVTHQTAGYIDGCPLVKARRSLGREESELAMAGKVYLITVDPILDGERRLLGFVHTMRDITERKQMEEALRAEKNKVEAILTALGDGISIQDRNLTVLYQNEVHKGFVGSHVGEACYRAYQQRQTVCPDCPVVLSLTDGKVHRVERRLVGPSGTVRYFEIITSPLHDGAGEIVAGIEMVRDVTERKLAEAQLVQAQKMEGIGHLAGGVAHDFNNVLNVIQGYVDLLRLTRAVGEGQEEYLNQIVVAVRRGATITRQILAFSRKEAMNLRPVNVNEVVACLQKMLRRLVREDIDIQIKLAKRPLVIKADAGQIDQILINLTTNACHAMPDGGTLGIETSPISFDEDFVRTHGYGRPGDYAMLTVSDTGCGMSEEVRQRIFEPFFTTKEVGQGTGLGLAMVYGIVRKHNGYINVYSEPGHGTVFRIYLPCLTGEEAVWQEEDDGATGPAEAVRGGSETILAAEDDPSLRQWLQERLPLAGYTVLTAADGQEAVDIYREQQDRIHLVLLDGIMPRKNGREALLEMRALRPDLKAIILSGYVAELFSPRDIDDLRVRFLEKPVQPNHLLRAIRQALDEA